MSDKATLRATLMQRRDALDRRAERSAAIAARVRALPQYTAATAIHCFLPMRSEVDVRPIIAGALADGKKVAIPITTRGAAELTHAWIDSLDEAAFGPGHFGTLLPLIVRPATPGEWQFTVVPLLGFDRRGHRLGYGKGYYDRLLATAPMFTVGVAFAAQEVAALPDEPHDVPLNAIVTEAETLVLVGNFGLGAEF